jgi:hypothetical protein
MGVHTDRWIKAEEELKIYDRQLEQITSSPAFLSLIAGTTKPILDPKTQLFLVEKVKVSRRSQRAKV